MDKKMLSDSEKKAKMAALQDLRSKAGMNQVEKLKKVIKPKAAVQVAASSKKGLEEGLDKAKQVVEAMNDSESPEAEHEEMESSEHEASESPAAEMAEHTGESDEDLDAMVEQADQLSPEKLDELLAKLDALKQEKQS